LVLAEVKLRYYIRQYIKIVEEVCGKTLPLKGCEVGVLKGKLSVALLKHLPRLHLIMVDRWLPYPKGRRTIDSTKENRTKEDMYGAMLCAMNLTHSKANRRTVLVADSTIASCFVADESLDFVFIDACHTYWSVKMDLQLWYPKVRPGGLFSGHDYGGVRNTQRRALFGVNRAVDEFAKKYNATVKEGSGASRIWYWQKGV